MAQADAPKEACTFARVTNYLQLLFSKKMTEYFKEQTTISSIFKYISPTKIYYFKHIFLIGAFLKTYTLWCGEYHSCTPSFNSAWTQVLRKLKSCLRRNVDSQ